MIVVIVAVGVVLVIAIGLALASSGSSRPRPSYPPTPPASTYAPPPTPAPTYVVPITAEEIQSTLQRRLGYEWQKQQEATRTRLLDQEARVNRRLQVAMQTYQFEELKALHRQSYQTADLVYAQLQQARSASNSLGYAISGSAGSTAAAVRRDKVVIDSFVNQYYSDVLRLNRATGSLRDKIRDNCGTAGRNWYNDLMRRREQRRRDGS